MPESQVNKSDDENSAADDTTTVDETADSKATAEKGGPEKSKSGAVKTKEARATGKKVSAEVKKSAKGKKGTASKKSPGAKPKKTPRAPGSRRWVPPVFIVVGLLGVAWLITYYVAGQQIPYMSDLGNWNILIGMGGMAASFVIATFWK